MTGGRPGRIAYYLARRHLGFSVAEWQALPWWQSRLYAEGLAEEFADPGVSHVDDVGALGVTVRTAHPPP